MSAHTYRLATAIKMTDVLSHRGPDGRNIWNDKKAYLGFRHLVFVGEDQALQPLNNEDNTVHVVCNGEIYNYLELYAKLIEKGHKFATTSDCEVIVHLYEEYGSSFCKYLRGQFACVVWDSKKNSVFAARDRFGICPLFYTITSDHIIFASEIKAIFTDKTIERRLDMLSVAQLVLLYGPASPKTCFAGISQVSPGSIIFFDVTHWTLQTKTYWSIDIQHTKSTHDITRQFYTLFLAAVKKRMHGNFMPAVYASGGLDSSIVAVTLKKYLGKIDLFSLQFNRAPFDESYYQNLLATYLGATLHPIRITASDLVANIKDCIPT